MCMSVSQARIAGMSKTTVIVQTMGVPSRWKMPDQLLDQLRLARGLSNELVERRHAYEQAVRDIWSSYPAVRTAETALAAAETEAEAAKEAVAAERARLRTKRVTGPIADRAKSAYAAVKKARAARRDAIAEVRDAAEDRLREAADRLKAEHKALYQRYCTNGDLYWATFNAVVDHHKTAVKTVQRLQSQGLPAQLRFHRFDGTGTIAVQLQRQDGVPPRTPATVADPDGRWRNVLQLPWLDPDGVWDQMTRAEQRRAGRIEARIRCGSAAGEPAWITVPLQAHRWLPAGADITGAQLTVTRTAGHLRARLAVTAKVPAAVPVTGGPTVALHLGWLREDAGTRVATWRSTAPLDIPGELAGVMAAGPDARTGTIVVPALIAARLDRHAETKSVRDLSLAAVRDKLVSWLTEHGPATYRDSEITAGEVSRWKSPARFAALATAWRADPPDRGEEIAGVLEMWRAADRRLWESSEHGRRRALGRRDDLYRQVAAVLAAQAATVVVDDTGIADLARGAVSRSDLPNQTQQAIDRRRDHAAPGFLRQAVVSAAARDGVEVVTVPAAGLSRVHANCGHENPADDRYLTRPVRCDGCGADYDPDASATVLMLRRANV